MQEIVTHFTDGLAAFEITESGMVIPMHLSENVCDFFGLHERGMGADDAYADTC